MVMLMVILFSLGLLVLLHILLTMQLLPSKLAFYLRFFTFFWQLQIGAALCILLWPLMSDRNDPYYLPRWVLIKFLGAQRFFKLRVSIRGKRDNFHDGPVVLVCNHQSSLDMIPTFLAIPKQTGILSKKELAYAGVFGLAHKLCRGVFVDRGNAAKARETMQKLADKMLKENLNVWIFAEGTRNRQEFGLLPFKKGAFYLAVQAGVPVVPVVISSYKPFYDKQRRILHTGGKVIVSYLPAIDSKNYTTETVGNFAQAVRDVMLAEFSKISTETGGAAVGAPASAALKGAALGATGVKQKNHTHKVEIKDRAA